MPDNESKIDTAAILEAIEALKQRIKNLDAMLERDNAAREERGTAEIYPAEEIYPASITEAKEAIRQLIKDLDAAVQRIRERGANTDAG